MAQENFTVICYDIANDRRRRRVVLELERWGNRAQESVFECWLSSEDLKVVHRHLLKIINSENDSLALYVLAESDHADIFNIGRGLPCENIAHTIC
jgi:CRISPR-associated protein Cas2